MGESKSTDTLKKYLIGIATTLLAFSVTAATAWNFKTTSEMAEKYTLKPDFAKFMIHNEKEHAAIQLKLDKIYSTMLELHAIHYRETVEQ